MSIATHGTPSIETVYHSVTAGKSGPSDGQAGWTAVTTPRVPFLMVRASSPSP
ncbi:MAG: hypothetical protein KGI27_14020 [Thaumarchaeota archaeon]|nr:hypothetical protein [Nitrososphaerota archaeon]